MTKCLFVLPAHPDDELLTMWAYIHYLASGYDVHIVFLTRGEVTAASLRLDPDPAHYAGGVQLPCLGHGYLHNPAKEQFMLPTVEEIGLARLAEGIASAGAMAMCPPTNPAEPGFLFTHDENLGTAYGCGGCASSMAPYTPEGVALAEAVIRRLNSDYPGSLFWTHSPTDAHPDHAAAGVALRNCKNDPVIGPGLVNSRFFVSKLYWSTAAGQPGSRLAEPCAWYPNTYPNNFSDEALNFTRRAEYTAWIKAQVIPTYTAWLPTAKAFAIGAKHSTPSQFANCFGSPPPFKAAALWHA